MRTVRLRITGRVQGVGYRVWATGSAGRLGLRGWVRNRPDGAVEISATGDDNAIAAMIAACRQGPPDAHVVDIAVAADTDDGCLGFGVRATE